jgi:signal peptidase II
LRILYISLFVVVIDQVTKFLVKGLKIEWLGLNIDGMSYGMSKPVIGDFLKITFIENPGMAFGIDVGPKMFLTIFTILASFVILYYIYKHRHDGFLIRLSLSLILAGAVGNLIDRTFYGVIYKYASIFQGRVVDFVQVDFWDFTIFGRTYTTWPIFNVADVSVTIGFLVILLFHKKIFKTHDEEQVAVSTDTAVVPDNNMIPENNSQLHNNNLPAGFEDPKQDTDNNSPGTAEDKNR